jgi:hypothetical protein
MRKSIDDSKKKFKKSYVAKDYAAALAVIHPVATQCKPFLHWVESAWVLNDLALTQFKLGDHAACIRTLQDLAPDAAKSDADITSDSEATRNESQVQHVFKLRASPRSGSYHTMNTRLIGRIGQVIGVLGVGMAIFSAQAYGGAINCRGWNQITRPAIRKFICRWCAQPGPT